LTQKLVDILIHNKGRDSNRDQVGLVFAKKTHSKAHWFGLKVLRLLALGRDKDAQQTASADQLCKLLKSTGHPDPTLLAKMLDSGAEEEDDDDNKGNEDDGKESVVWVNSDPEGNAPGWLDYNPRDSNRFCKCPPVGSESDRFKREMALHRQMHNIPDSDEDSKVPEQKAAVAAKQPPDVVHGDIDHIEWDDTCVSHRHAHCGTCRKLLTYDYDPLPPLSENGNKIVKKKKKKAAKKAEKKAPVPLITLSNDGEQRKRRSPPPTPPTFPKNDDDDCDNADDKGGEPPSAKRHKAAA
jgi:hypothetical protein